MTARLNLGNLAGNLAQVSGSSAGFDVFTPRANLNYYLVVAGKDVADGGTPAKAFVDIVVLNAVTGWAPSVLSSTNTVGAPGARTYSNNGGALHVAVAGGAVTYRVDLFAVRFAF